MRYVSNKTISFSIRVKGAERSVRVNFETCANGGSSFSTNAPKLIEAMESSDMYGRVYKRAPECAAVAAKKRARALKTEPKAVAVTAVATWQDAVEYLTDKCGVAETLLTSPDAILKEAAKLNVKFPNIG